MADQRQNVDYATWKSKLSAHAPSTWLPKTVASKVTEDRQATIHSNSGSNDSSRSTHTPVTNEEPNFNVTNEEPNFNVTNQEPNFNVTNQEPNFEGGKPNSTSSDSITSVQHERIDDIEYMIHSSATAKKGTEVQRTPSCAGQGFRDVGPWKVSGFPRKTLRWSTMH